MSDTDDILRKIKKCLALSKSLNEHEAAIALKQAKALMEKHNLSEADALASEAVERFSKAGAFRRPAAWECSLVCIVADAFLCRSIFHSRYPTGQWGFIGAGGNPGVAQYTFDVLFRQLKKSRADYMRTALKRCKKTKTQRADFYCIGYVNRLARLVDAFVDKENPHEEVIRAFVDKRYPALVTLKQSDRNKKGTASNRDFSDFHAGSVAGKDAKLLRPMEGNSPSRLLT